MNKLEPFERSARHFRVIDLFNKGKSKGNIAKIIRDEFDMTLRNAYNVINETRDVRKKIFEDDIKYITSDAQERFRYLYEQAIVDHDIALANKIHGDCIRLLGFDVYTPQPKGGQDKPIQGFMLNGVITLATGEEQEDDIDDNELDDNELDDNELDDNDNDIEIDDENEGDENEG